LVGGAYARFGIGSIFAIQPEVLYSQKGFKLDDVIDIDGQPVNADATFSLDYIEIPLLLVARLDLPLVRPGIYAGGVVAFESTCDVDGTLSMPGQVQPLGDCDAIIPGDPESSLDRKKTDWGTVFGAYVDLKLGPVVLTLDGRYQLGLQDLNDDPAAVTGEDIKNRTWQIMAGVGIDIL
jgi:hypothetical protein